MADTLGFITGGGSREQQTFEPGPIQEAFNQLRLDQLEALFADIPFSEYGAPQPSLFRPSREASDVIANALSLGDSSLLDIEDYISMGLDEASNFISEVATPQIMSQATLQGLEGGGYVPDAIARATAGVALPFLSTLPSANLSFATAPGARASSLLPLADFPRMLSESDFLRRQGVATTGLTGLPFQPRYTQAGFTRQPSAIENIFGIGSSTGSTFGYPGGLGGSY